MAEPRQQDVLRGTLDRLILKTHAPDSMHGRGVSQRTRQLSEDAHGLGHASLDPALQRLEQRGWNASEGRRAESYRPTRSGRKALGGVTSSWWDCVAAVERILGAT
ncbi:MAG: PadR family transcriptional regulator [Gemmatimonadota bacterium]